MIDLGVGMRFLVFCFKSRMQVELYQKWYDFFNNPRQPIYKVLIHDQSIFPGNVIIAKKNGTHWSYTKFISLQHFINFFNNTIISQRTFYVILTEHSRYLYLDIDFKLNHKMSIQQHDQLICKLTHCLNKFTRIYGYKFGVKYYQTSWLIWDASRFDENEKIYHEKFSLHIIDCGNVIHYLDIKNFAETFQYWLIKNDKINCNCRIDNNIYHNGYQAWRLPYNHNGNIKSYLTMYKKKMPLNEQMRVNTMIKAQILSTKCISINHEHNSKRDLQICNLTTHLQTPVYNKSFNIQHHACNVNISNKILQKIYNQFKITGFLNYKNNEYIIKRHYCPIKHQKHKSNSGRIKIIQMCNNDNFAYYIYTCMDSDCQRIIKKVYVSLSQCFNRPWLMHGLQTLDITILHELDYFVHLLLQNEIIRLQSKSNQLILKQHKLKLNLPTYLFTTFCHNHIQHTDCKGNDISISYKKTQHPQSHYGNMTLYCRNCKRFVNMKDNTLICNV